MYEKIIKSHKHETVPWPKISQKGVKSFKKRELSFLFGKKIKDGVRIFFFRPPHLHFLRKKGEGGIIKKFFSLPPPSNEARFRGRRLSPLYPAKKEKKV